MRSGAHRRSDRCPASQRPWWRRRLGRLERQIWPPVAGARALPGLARVPRGVPTVSAPSALAAQTTSPLPAAPTTTASIDPSVSVVKPTPVPAAAPVATTAPAVVDKTAATAKQDKQDKQPATAMTSEPASPAKSMTEQQATAAQPSGSLVASKSMMGPPDPAAGKLLEPTSLPKIPPAASMPEVASLGPKASDEREAASSAAAPELVASRTEWKMRRHLPPRLRSNQP